MSDRDVINEVPEFGTPEWDVLARIARRAFTATAVRIVAFGEEDADQEAHLALLTALESWEPGRGSLEGHVAAVSARSAISLLQGSEKLTAIEAKVARAERKATEAGEVTPGAIATSAGVPIDVATEALVTVRMKRDLEGIGWALPEDYDAPDEAPTPDVVAAMGDLTPDRRDYLFQAAMTEAAFAPRPPERELLGGMLFVVLTAWGEWTKYRLSAASGDDPDESSSLDEIDEEIQLVLDRAKRHPTVRALTGEDVTDDAPYPPYYWYLQPEERAQPGGPQV